MDETEAGGSTEALKTEALKAETVNHLHALAVQEKLEIRQSVSKTVFWAAGLSVAAVAWIITNSVSVQSNRVIMTLGCVLFFGSLAALLAKQRSYFDGVARVIRNCDDFYKVFVPGHYVENETLYPVEWKAFSTREWREPIFDISAIILLFSAIVTVGAIWIVEQPATRTETLQSAPAKGKSVPGKSTDIAALGRRLSLR